MPIGWRKVRRLVEDALALAAPNPGGHSLIVRHACDNVRHQRCRNLGVPAGVPIPPRLRL